MSFVPVLSQEASTSIRGEPMPRYGYTRNGTLYRNWFDGATLHVAGYDVRQIKVPNPDSLTEGWPLEISTTLNMDSQEGAHRRGGEQSIEVINRLVLIGGFRIDVRYDGIAALDPTPQPGNFHFVMPLIYRADPIPPNDLDQIQQSLAVSLSTYGVGAMDSQLRLGLSWFADAFRDESIGRFIKMFVALDIFVPRNPRRGSPSSFAVRGARALALSFPEIGHQDIQDSLSGLADVRNDLFHDGEPNGRFNDAQAILEGIVRSYLLRRFGLMPYLPLVSIFRVP